MSSQAVNSVQSQHQQSPSPAEPQQMVNSEFKAIVNQYKKIEISIFLEERDNERSTQSSSEQQQEYQTVPAQTPQPHVVNTNNAPGTGNSPSTMSASVRIDYKNISSKYQS